MADWRATRQEGWRSLTTAGTFGAGVAAVIDDTPPLNSLQQAAYEKCKPAFDWSARGRTLCDAIQQSVNRQRAAHAEGASP